jgi:hypothetical protein
LLLRPRHLQHRVAGHSVTQGGTTSAFTYAGTNSKELLRATHQGGYNYSFVYGKTDQAGLPEIEQVTLGGISTPAYIQHDPATGAPLLIQTTNGRNCLYMTDMTGNPILLATDFQTTSYAKHFDPYGAATQTAGGSNGGTAANPYQVHFGLQDRTTGNVKFGGRYLDPTTGT